MREIRQSGSEGGVADNGHPYPYRSVGQCADAPRCGDDDALGARGTEGVGTEEDQCPAAQPRTKPMHWAISGTELSQLYSYSTLMFPMPSKHGMSNMPIRIWSLPVAMKSCP